MTFDLVEPAKMELEENRVSSSSSSESMSDASENEEMVEKMIEKRWRDKCSVSTTKRGKLNRTFIQESMIVVVVVVVYLFSSFLSFFFHADQ